MKILAGPGCTVTVSGKELAIDFSSTGFCESGLCPDNDSAQFSAARQSLHALRTISNHLNRSSVGFSAKSHCRASSTLAHPVEAPLAHVGYLRWLMP